MSTGLVPKDHVELRSRQWKVREKLSLYVLGHAFLAVLIDKATCIFKCHEMTKFIL